MLIDKWVVRFSADQIFLWLWMINLDNTQSFQLKKSQGLLKRGTWRKKNVSTIVLLFKENHWLKLKCYFSYYFYAKLKNSCNHITNTILYCIYFLCNCGPALPSGSLLEIQNLEPHLKFSQTNICILGRSLVILTHVIFWKVLL